MTSDEVREAFLRFFEKRQHRVIPGSSLVPHGDPTLLLTSAGMVQIKPYFQGLAVPPGPRLASCQKCFRTTDIDSVGDANHLTFFEMLGNFSVGDYFKREAIAWAWEFVSDCLKLPGERLWVSIYLDDDEAFDAWREIGFPEQRIVRLGEEDNFWGPAGDSGPCGPCSEIHYDFGAEVGCGRYECAPGCDCGRFSEIWNLVFTQYNQDPDGSRSLLPKPNIDTGMGLERTAGAMQGVSSVYDTDLFLPLRDEICRLTGKAYGSDEQTDQGIRIVAEHARGIAFLLADGVLPSNEGRGYVLRRILRRACFFGRKLGVGEPFLGEVSDVVVGKMGRMYPELATNQSLIREVVRIEEEKFISTLDAGINLVEKAIDEATSRGTNQITGEHVFRFWDTYGFPSELTAEIARGKGMAVDLEAFEAEMEKQRERARAVQKFSGSAGAGKGEATITCRPASFVGYDRLSVTCTISYILEQESGLSKASAHEGERVAIVLDETPFYGEIGGQVGDSGVIIVDSTQVDVANTVWSPFGSLAEGAIVHLGQVVRGSVSVGDTVEASVDEGRRLDIARNHTATHLLQAALRRVLGGHVYQRGSLVAPDRLRFDFSHVAAISKEQLGEIRRIVSERVRQNLPVKSRVVPYNRAIAEGAIALFEEKYGETVRVVEVGEPPISAELCGGTHVEATGEIGSFLVIGESGIGTGLRRIEATTGRGAETFFEQRLHSLDAIADELRSSPWEAEGKVKTLIADLAAERKRVDSLERELSRNIVGGLLGKTEQINGVTVLAARVPPSSMPVLRQMGDLTREQLKSAVIVLGTVYNGKPGFVAMVTSDLWDKGLHAGEIVKRVAGVTGGGGGGKAAMAQAGGRDKSKLDEALGLVRQLVEEAG